MTIYQNLNKLVLTLEGVKNKSEYFKLVNRTIRDKCFTPTEIVDFKLKNLTSSIWQESEHSILVIKRAMLVKKLIDYIEMGFIVDFDGLIEAIKKM